jgi:hypothetical protein
MKTIIHALIFLLSRVDLENLNWHEQQELKGLLDGLSDIDNK